MSERTLDRQIVLENIEAKSDDLVTNSQAFADGAAATKRMFCRRHWRNVALIVTICAVLLGLIIWWATK